MSKKQKFNVDDAYAIKTPADSVRLYGEWADTYDSGMVEREGYVVYLREFCVIVFCIVMHCGAD